MPEPRIDQNHDLVTVFDMETRQIGADAIQTVNARVLHDYLEVGSAFKDWIARRISDYGFAEGRDFCSFLSESLGGRPAKEYAISLDMAKELAMVERNEKGKQARQYFIECERRAKAGADPMVALNDPSAMRGLLLVYAEKAIEMQGQIEEMRPQVQALERIALSDGSLCITDAAKTLQVQPKNLFMFLREHHWIYTRAGGDGYIAYQEKLAQGLLEHKTTTVTKSDGYEKTVTQVRVTSKGLARLAREFPPVAQAA